MLAVSTVVMVTGSRKHYAAMILPCPSPSGTALLTMTWTTPLTPYSGPQNTLEEGLVMS